MALTLKPLGSAQPQYKAISGSQLCIGHCLLPLVTHVTSVTSALARRNSNARCASLYGTLNRLTNRIIGSFLVSLTTTIISVSIYL
ncbi:hypothetical protein BT96DRAFT_929380 [Gymnopus androsaceus JB14]|uniref:Uncharacterized protein n=1 Tax=Gymnopus androsaceus JB14 TaxID=1447944 RepID=A0A6A4GG60_9AGAR|nr:hypothetical protein BT96DRAFT_929380 [Gymnopus androsaceus JB14]